MSRFVAFTCLFIAALALVASPAIAQQPTHKPGGYHSPEIQKDQSWSHVFNATGLTQYHCHPHPFMTGVVDVQEGASTSPVTILISGFKFVPERVVVGVGTNVTWTNRDASFHTVDESLVTAATGEGGGRAPGLGVPLLLVALVATLVLHRYR